MNPQVNSAASRVFSKVLAEFAFLFGDAVAPGELPACDGHGYLACLPFRGALEGSVAIVVSETLAVEMAASTLGREPGDPEAAQRAQDVVRELASIIGGQLVTALAEPGTDVEFSPPVLFALQDEDWERLRQDSQTQCFDVNAHPAMLRVVLNREGVSA
jgi:chemotaxis protein CheY-P-specific phosphatase CheC